VETKRIWSVRKALGREEATNVDSALSFTGPPPGILIPIIRRSSAPPPLGIAEAVLHKFSVVYSTGIIICIMMLTAMTIQCLQELYLFLVLILNMGHDQRNALKEY
jgi:hypothetical protein